MAELRWVTITTKSRYRVPQVIKNWLKWREHQSQWTQLQMCHRRVTFNSHYHPASVFPSYRGWENQELHFPESLGGLSSDQTLNSTPEVSSAQCGDPEGSRCLTLALPVLVKSMDLIPRPLTIHRDAQRQSVAGHASWPVFLWTTGVLGYRCTTSLALGGSCCSSQLTTGVWDTDAPRVGPWWVLGFWP